MKALHLYSLAFLAFNIPCEAFSQQHINGNLRSLREIEIETNVSNHGQCTVSEQDVRSATINRLIPAGLNVLPTSSSSESRYLQIRITSLNPTGLEVCAANINLSLRTITSIPSIPTSNTAETTYTVAIAVLWERGTMYSRGRLFFTNDIIREVLPAYLDHFLADWRIANAGADFVRQMPPTGTRERREENSPNIRTVQARLQVLGLYSGIADGIVGQGTRQAIQAFQRGQSMPATGDLDMETMRRLFP